jgi:hypothetical protein
MSISQIQNQRTTCNQLKGNHAENCYLEEQEEDGRIILK